MESEDTLIGKKLGRYKILSLIDKGGMGKVYLAEHISIGKKVALKTLLMGWLSDLSEFERREIEERFRREAHTIAQVSHENVVEIYDSDTASDGQPAYIAMELLEGKSLANLLKDKGPLLLDQAIPLMIQISQGIADAHKKGVVHRDLKPANIMVVHSKSINKADIIKIIDFGIAKIFDSDLTKLTKLGQVMGTPKYMSPEQISSDQATEIDSRSDVYSLSLIFYEMLVGNSPFKCKRDNEWLIAHLVHTPEELPQSIPSEIRDLIMDGLEKVPDKRPQSAVELSSRLVKITEQIENQRKEKEQQLLLDIKNRLSNSLARIEQGKKDLASKDKEILKLTEEKKKLQLEVNSLSVSEAKIDNTSELEKINSVIQNIGYKLIGDIKHRAVIIKLKDENNSRFNLKIVDLISVLNSRS